MPSKGLSVLILIVVVGATVGLAQIDRRRDVPLAPAELGAFLGSAAVGTGPSTGAPPESRAPGDGGEPRIEAPSPPGEEPSAEEGMLRLPDLDLVVLSERTTVALRPDEDDVIVLKLKADGEMRWMDGEKGWLAVELGTYGGVADLSARAAVTRPGALLVITPEAETPWKRVAWAIRAVREKGFLNLGIGVSPDTDREGTMLAMFAAPQPAEPYVEDEVLSQVLIEVLPGEDGTPDYLVQGESAADRAELNALVSKWAKSYGAMFDEDETDEYLAILRDPSRTPFAFKAPPDMSSRDVLRGLEAVRRASVYVVRFPLEDLPPAPR